MSEFSENESLDYIRQTWAGLWGKQPHKGIGRAMLEKSIAFKRWEKETGGLAVADKKHLDRLVKAYQADPTSLDNLSQNLKPGTRLIKTYKGKRHSVIVLSDGFEYNGKNWRSLSAIATHITGTRWNGRKFFLL